MENNEDFKKVIGFIEEADELRGICNRLYIARNITLSAEGVEECLREIDRLFRDNENYN